MKPRDWEAFKYWGNFPPQPECSMIRPLGVPTDSTTPHEPENPVPAYVRMMARQRRVRFWLRVLFIAGVMLAGSLWALALLPQ